MPTDRWRYLANCFFRFPGIDKSGNDQSYRVELVLQWIPRKAQQKTRYAMDKKKKRKEKRENKRRIRGKKKKMSMRRKREMVLWRWRRVTTTVRIFHNSTLGFGMLAYKFASAAHFFFSPLHFSLSLRAILLFFPPPPVVSRIFTICRPLIPRGQ